MQLIRDIWRGLPFQVRIVLAAAIGVLIILLVVLARVDSCRTHREEQRIEQTKDAAKTAAIEANVLTNEKREVEKTYDQANSNLGNVLGTDTAGRDGNFGTVRAKFCADHPADSKCRK